MSHINEDTSKPMDISNSDKEFIVGQFGTTSKFLKAQQAIYKASAICNHIIEKYNQPNNIVRTDENNVIDAYHLHGTIDGDCLRGNSIGGVDSNGKTKFKKRTIETQHLKDSIVDRYSTSPESFDETVGKVQNDKLANADVVVMIVNKYLKIGTESEVTSTRAGIHIQDLNIPSGFESKFVKYPTQNLISLAIKWTGSDADDYWNMISNSGMPVHGQVYGVETVNANGKYVLTGFKMNRIFIRSRGSSWSSHPAGNKTMLTRYDRNATLYSRKLGFEQLP
jgi:hypothetical protein|tara:strand:+ start:1114 stop:1953 length:840 start_codon:yes stop_codon:yes gene_type:complete